MFGEALLRVEAPFEQLLHLLAAALARLAGGRTARHAFWHTGSTHCKSLAHG